MRKGPGSAKHKAIQTPTQSPFKACILY